jgi:glycosyltransferase involved in cell wall biosynthesis
MPVPAACTIVANNYLPFARVLVRSFLEHHPDGQFTVLIADRPLPGHCYEQEPFRVVFAEELGIPLFRSFAFRYSIVELNTAVKPYFLAHLGRQSGCDRVCYFDPDILITGRLDDLYRLLRENDLVLTPHVTAPIEDSAQPGERHIIESGVYNLGFLGLSFNAQTEKFLEWWQRKLYRDCLERPERALFVDQRWMDMAPALLPRVAILRDPGYNVAYWNLVHRRLSHGEEGWRVGDVPLRFYHFSGFDPEQPDEISRYQDRYPLSARPDLEPLLRRYTALLAEAGYAAMRPCPYAHGAFENGVAIPRPGREALRQIDPLGERWPDPFATNSPDSFYDWLLDPVDARADAYLPRVALCLWDQHPYLHALFPFPTGRDRRRYAAWYVEAGRRLRFDEAFLRPVEAWLRAAARHSPGAAPLSVSLAPAAGAADGADAGNSDGSSATADALSAEDLQWLTAPADHDAQRRPRIPRLLMRLYNDRNDLRRVFPDPFGASRMRLALRYVTHARKEYGLDEEVLLPVLRSLPLRKRLGVARWWRRLQSRPELHPRGAATVAESHSPAETAREPVAIPARSAAVTAGAGGVNVIGCPDLPTGIGAVCWATLAALEAAELPHALWQLAEPVLEPREWPDTQLHEPELRFEISLYHVNADMMETVHRRTPRSYDIGRYRIGYWFWELSHFPLAFAHAFRYVEEVWAPSRFCLDSFRALAPVPVRWVPPCVLPPVSPPVARSEWGVPEDAFLFFNAFDLHSVPERKNPAGLLAAFAGVARQAERPVCLLLKVNHADADPELVAELREAASGLPVILFTRAASRDEMSAMTAACDAYVSLHRSEGLGVPLIEAMYAGKPVIATGYGGVTDFLDETTGWVVRHTLQVLEEAHGPYPAGSVWAEPDVEHAAALMRQVMQSPEAACARSATAAAKVTELYSPAAAGQRFREELRRIRESILARASAS